MFTAQKQNRWSYMLLTALASIVIAAIAALFTTRSMRQVGKNNKPGSEQATGVRYGQQNTDTAVRFIN